MLKRFRNVPKLHLSPLTIHYSPLLPPTTYLYNSREQEMMQDPQNTMFSLAADFIHYTNRSVFLTGKAGTGKTTFLKYIRANTIKQTAVVAPTGVAAINAGGVTIHSFFQLPFTPYIPESRGFQPQEESIDKHHLLGRIKLTKERRQVLQQLELLVIDEISMVRCDVLDAIDVVLRHFRNRYAEPFGGVQMLFIGDMFQLPPVASDEEWGILSRYYDSTFFFDSKVIQQQKPVHIELDKIYRQNEQAFIDLLNKVRTNTMDDSGFRVLNDRFDPDFQPVKGDGYITLTTHNNKADAINAAEIAKLTSPRTTFKAVVTGDFGERAYPAEELLQLRVGAQVMFIKNDVEKVRRYFNGKIGTVTKLTDEAIFVQCKDDINEIEVKKEKWENVKYSINATSQQVEDEVLGTFEQFPLRLAWAITIHKSQGLTFEKAVIDAGAAFASGQVYVALSRCTTLNGMVLRSRISSSSIRSNEHIIHFSNQRQSADYLHSSLQEDKKQYQGQLIVEIFDFKKMLAGVNKLHQSVLDHLSAFSENTMPWIEQQQQAIEALQNVALKFRSQLQQYVREDIVPEKNMALQDRSKAAANYFAGHLKLITEQLPQSPAVTDSRPQALNYNEILQELFLEVARKEHIMKGLSAGFTLDSFYALGKSFIMPAFKANAYAAANKGYKTDLPNIELYRELKQLRDAICDQKDLPIFMVAGGKTLEEMSRYLPQTEKELEQISGFGKAKVNTYGKQFLRIITAYSEKHNLSSEMHERKTIKKQPEKNEAAPKIDTKAETYKLFAEGKTISEIATARNFTVQTIEGHLAHYVEKGIIPVEKLVDREKVILIEPEVKKLEGESLTVIKAQLGDNVSFGEIKLVLASLQLQKSNTEAANTQ
ncbi:helix-turn-helix domain-containing protein [Danxiaibacter flavus]|uniref:Helix-turn-helix domain-containing protein n=1 Tax=Danxiaibacter flavus TaxID=3049108 RepID=A0ABV3ZHJ2_9BACT|nr:helix-turn-helix domain-containing protein [Chitinophagaceae bacterium DXS]